MIGTNRPDKQTVNCCPGLAGRLCGLLAALWLVPALAQTDLPDDLTGLSLDTLLDIEVTSVSKKSEPLAEAAAAVYVLTGEDIRRSGARSIPDALRLVPGVQVSQVDAHSWAVSARGFNTTVADKLEVLLDGRSLYTPLFSGVFWDVQNTLLEDIDRIEIVRGPGGALWGANAVNGVINIITKPAADTQGSYIEAGTGTERHFTAMRSGGKLGESGHFRAYGMAYDRDNQALPENANPALVAALNGRDQSHDRAGLAQLGFRADWSGSSRNDFTLQGDYYDGTELDAVDVGGTLMPVETDVSGWNILSRWNHQLGSDSSFSLQFYYDHSKRNTPQNFSEVRDTWDLDFRHRFSSVFWGRQHEIVWGGGYRRSDDETTGVAIGFIPADRSLEKLGLFVQDTVGFYDDRLKVTVGAKVEENDFTGTEFQPSARVAWLPDARRTLWASVSRAVRIPNRFDAELGLGGLPLGNPDLKSEKVIAYEVGYRWRVRDNLAFDTALFYNDYKDLRTLETPPNPPFFAFDNKQQGKSYGLEVATTWQLNADWRLKSGYSYLKIRLDKDPDSTDMGILPPAEGLDPEHQLFVTSNWQIRSGLSLDSSLRFVDALPNTNGTNRRVPSYTELDLRLAWQPVDNLELSLVGRNLLNEQHRESNGENASEIERGVYGQISWRF